MIGYLVFGLLAVIALLLLFHIFRSKEQGDISGKLIWTDYGIKTKPFYHSEFLVFGKPDLMYKVRRGVKAVEYKHRMGPVFDSDIAQALAAALAARGSGYRVIEVLVKTRSTELSIDLRESDSAVYRKLQGYVLLVRQAKDGRAMQKKPEARKCRSCAYREACA
ncbi:hypothetical protein C0068_16370 [Zhongshania marina]|uniref:PD-(D/E)XK endonuclease-like domain-containing protein n=1 Tax=Zhongshania marina TaxID=2304603 RepID=A0A2S4HCA0_9GAMM|nr:hypothetical protein C0068_16370 [Marortus luteolus]